MSKVNPARKGRNGRKPLSARDRAHINELFERIKGSSCADSEDGQLLMEVLEPHYRPSGASVMDEKPIDIVREVREAVAELPPEKLREARVRYLQLESDQYARDAAMEYEQRSVLVNAKANAAYAHAFADINERIRKK